MIVLGLTGSIGMGKSTTAEMFRKSGIPVHDADAAVHRLYAAEAVDPIEAAFPGTTSLKGVDRTRLSRAVVGDEAAMKRLEAIVHPLVRREKEKFLNTASAQGAGLVVLDIPLLFETGGEQSVDGIVVVTAPADIQRHRVLAREGMDVEKFEAILGRQIPDHEKRKRANFVIDTSLGMESAQNAVDAVITEVNSGKWDPARHSG